ncbi:T9SS C-terminal target domain-containing protein [Parabacteroides sp. 52]|uniref:trypsin-like peptidase domain-containing protein n=1 Tax=unclassified Parabacteroides TaxID=2649774 RepID=UPI0013D550B4|nr:MULTISPECIES: trypsin-like peptidase domain-containing protein [unclassified Parabacteroides]MDH6535426.1 lysyl endopeptidase [Parabacteroides sp. PM5-20]NDV56070.1 T9SS C-terminal target domain-containing protein [Parabacteroides sp. 52]
MRRIALFLILVCCLLPVCHSQVSYGGEPLPLIRTRISDDQWFKEMPSFDVAEELRIDSLNETDLRSSYRFAYKFITDYNRGNAGLSFTLPDGTRVWRLGIRSSGALSINILFTDYELPEGGRLFLYNADQTQVLGAFTHLNNSDLGILPVSPVYGEELIIEYQEPAHASFPGRLTVGEVNHAYRGFLRGREPGGELTDPYPCMPSPVCTDDPEITKLSQSVVLLIIEGTTSCTGVMVNNTSHDGKPYILTASHCINRNFQVDSPEGYIKIAGSIVCFFHYNSPLCEPVLRGSEELSVASSTCVALNEKHDMALLALLETPPVYYQPYYAGWNLSEELTPPFLGIHHPRGYVKRVNQCEEVPEITTFHTSFEFETNAHWYIRRWDAGCTAGGSSGSPLFDREGAVIGALSGGFSTCSNPVKDYYYALSRVWEPQDEAAAQLKHWLDPQKKGVTRLDGLDPYANHPVCERLSNVRTNGDTEKIETTSLPQNPSVPLFGAHVTGVTSFVESYTVAQSSRLYGTYIVTPSLQGDYSGLDVEICVYNGVDKPETLLHTEVFRPAYTDNKEGTSTFYEINKPMDRDQESFIHFSTPVEVEGRFFIGYRVLPSCPKDVYFSAFNLSKGSTTRNTTWLLYQGKWIQASEYSVYPMHTSLYIDPVVQEKRTTVGSDPIDPQTRVQIIVGAERRTLHVLLPEGIEKARLSLIDMHGRVWQDYTLSTNQSTLQLPGRAPGIYLAKLTYGDKEFVQKILF